MVKSEKRAVIKYLCKKGLSAQEIYQNMCEVLGESAPSDQIVKNWFMNFKLDRKSCNHAPGATPERTVITQENVDKVHNRVLQDRHVTVRFIAESCGFSVGNVETILHDELDLKRATARWVSRMLIKDHRPFDN